MSDPLQNDPPDFARLRIDYRQRALSESDVDPDPIRQFLVWLNQAVEADQPEPNAMTLATSAPGGIPDARIVLLKDVSPRGFAFFTNYLSRKGAELDANPHAALVFYWPALERQVRIDGTVERTTEAESDAYFYSRPLDARIGSAASPQSTVVSSRDELERRMNALRAAHPDGHIPRPAHWGGYRVLPRRFEFWQGRPSRLHDRIEYLWDEVHAQWLIRRLAP